MDLGAKQHGSDMIEPAALGKATVVGKYTGNFADAMHLLRARGGVVEVSTEEELERATDELLRDEGRRDHVARAGVTTVEAGRGATAQHVEEILRRVQR